MSALTLAFLTALATAVAAAPPPRCEAGRFALPEPLLLPGEVESTRLIAADADGTVRLVGTTCGAIAATAKAAGKYTVFKANVSGCGDGAFALKLKLKRGCTGATATVSQKKNVVSRVVGAPSRCGDRVIDPGNAEICELGQVALCLSTCELLDPKGDVIAAGPASAPRLDVLAPSSARPGQRIALFGENLDRRRDGNPGPPDYVIRFQNTGGTLTPAAFTVVSSAEISVLVPADAASGVVVMGLPAFEDPKGTTIFDATFVELEVVRRQLPPFKPRN